MSPGVDRLLSGQLANALKSDLPPKSSQFGMPWPTKEDSNRLLLLVSSLHLVHLRDDRRCRISESAEAYRALVPFKSTSQWHLKSPLLLPIKYDDAESRGSCPPCYCEGCPQAVEQCRTCGGNGLVVGSSGRPEDGPENCPDCVPRCVICGKEGLSSHRPPLCEKCRGVYESPIEPVKRLSALDDPAIGEAMRVTEEAFKSDDEEYNKIPALPKDGSRWRKPKGSECGECGLRFDYERTYPIFCRQRRCPLQGRNRPATGLLFTP